MSAGMGARQEIRVQSIHAHNLTLKRFGARRLQGTVTCEGHSHRQLWWRAYGNPNLRLRGRISSPREPVSTITHIDGAWPRRSMAGAVPPASPRASRACCRARGRQDQAFGGPSGPVLTATRHGSDLDVWPG